MPPEPGAVIFFLGGPGHTFVGPDPFPLSFGQGKEMRWYVDDEMGTRREVKYDGERFDRGLGRWVPRWTTVIPMTYFTGTTDINGKDK